MFCQGCQVDIDPVLSIGIIGGAVQKIPKCPQCDNKLGQPTLAAVDPRQLQGVVPTECPVEADGEPPATRQVPRKSPPTDILGMARQRLEFVRAEMEKLRQFEAEEQMLSRMIDAAGPPVLRVVG